MGIKFNADEILAMAVQIERNGGAFYRRAAELQADKERSAFLVDLAEMEDDHERIFAGMREQLAGNETATTSYDPEGQAGLYLAAMADGHGGEGTPSAAEKLTGEETLEDIVRKAIRMEGQSILFYIGIEDMVPAGLGKDRVNEIIKEEQKHIVMLTQILRDLD